MARLLPKVVQTLITQSPDATRVRDTLTQAVQPTLDFLNGYFGAAADGSLRILRNVSALGSWAINGDLNVVGGNVNVVTRATNGVVITPKGGTTAFYVTNAAGTVAEFIVDAAGNCTALGTINGNSFISAQGFKSYVPAGGFNNVTIGGSGGATTPLASEGNTFQAPMPFSGSVIGVGMTASTTAGGIAFFIARTGTVVWNVQPNLAGGTFSSGYQVIPKGSCPFNAGDYISLQCRATTTASATGVSVQGFLDIERSA